MNNINNNNTNNIVNNNNRKQPTNMKTMTGTLTPPCTLKALTLAAAVTLSFSLADPPVLNATVILEGTDITVDDETYHNYVYFGDGISSDPINIYGAGFINCLTAYVGSGFLPGTLNVFAGGRISAISNIDFSSNSHSTLNVNSGGNVYGGGINMGGGEFDNILNVDGTNAILEGRTFNIGAYDGVLSQFYVKNGGEALVDAIYLDGLLGISDGIVTVGSSMSINASAKLILDVGGGLFLSGDLYLQTGAQFAFGLNNSGAGVINANNVVSTVYPLGFVINVSTEELFSEGERFTIFEGTSALDGMFGYQVTAPTGQVFDIEYHNGISGIELVAQAAPIPEPSTYALLGGLGTVALALLRRRRKA